MVNNSKKKILVAMSGGVDSSTAAALLKKRGYEVAGVFFRFWKDVKARENKPSTTGNEDMARKVANMLGIKFKIVDASREFKKLVVDYFLKEYVAGRTPNPCVICNEQVKFKLLLNEANKIKADFIATGHYARLRREISNFKSPARNAFATLKRSDAGGQIQNKYQILNPKFQTFHLLQARDKNKDQSYFLYRLKQEQLARIIFPLGDYKKTEVRKMAKEFGLPNFKRKESQNVCFLANKEVSDFLKENIKAKKGKIVSPEGKILGEHQGLFLYTIGQRKGINIGGSGPYWVIEKDEKNNILRVTNNEKDKKLYSNGILVEDVNWVTSKPKLPVRVLVKTRYRQPSVYAIINKKKEAGSKKKAEYEIKFSKPQRAITAGQSAVFYDKKGEVMGGGIIK